MPSFRDLKGRELEEVATSRDDVTLGDDDGVPNAVGRPIVVAENPHRDEIAAARERALASRGPKPPRERTVGPHPPDANVLSTVSGYASVPLPPDMEAALVALEATIASAQQQVAAIRARAQADHEKLSKVEALIDALKV